MVKDYEIPDINQLKTLSMTELRDTVQQISQEQGFVDQHSLVEAIVDIVTIIHSSYEEQKISIEKILLTLRKSPIPRYRLDITKSDLAKKPLVVQIFLCTRQKNHPQRIFIGLGVKKLTNCRSTVLSLLKNTKRRPSINKSRPSANKLA